MQEERRRILDLLSEGKINAAEAERLLLALGSSAGGFGPANDGHAGGPWAGLHRMRDHLHRMHREHHGEGRGRRFIHIVVDKENAEGKSERVRIKVPVKLLKAGISLSGLLPRDVRDRVQEALKEKGLDVDIFALRGAEADEIVAALSDLEVDIGKTGEKVRIFTVDEDDDRDDEDQHGGGGGGGAEERTTTRTTEGPGGEQTVERTIRRRRFRRDSGFSFETNFPRRPFFRSVGSATVGAGALLVRILLTPVFVALWLATWMLRIVWSVVRFPFRVLARMGRAIRRRWIYGRMGALSDRPYAT